MIFETIFFILLLLVGLNLYLRKLCRDFDKAGIRYVKPYPIVGNFLNVILRREHLSTLLHNTSAKFPDDRYVGFFNFMVPMILMKDPRLIQDITVKNFSNFHDHNLTLSQDVEPLFGRSLVNLTGKKWREMRTNLSPVFTSSKMRIMFVLMADCSKRMVSYYQDVCQENLEKCGEASITLESRDMVTRLGTDVIASTAFGIEVDSLKDKDNQFFRMGQEAVNMDLTKFMGFITYPNILKMLGITLLSANCSNFFKMLLRHQINERETHNIFRPDMVHLLMEVRKGNLKNEDEITDVIPKQDNTQDSTKSSMDKTVSWTDDDFAAQAMLFFMAGFEGASATSNFLFFSLMTSPEVQDKLYQEVLAARQKENDIITYEVIHSMKYLDMVISELFRRYPSGATFIDRKCTASYKLPPPRDGFPEYTVKKGNGIWIPSTYVHINPQYWPEPEKFDPERFSNENKHKIVPYSYLPFGAGPRICIGNRFALMQLKVLAFYVVSNFEVVKCDKTLKTLELDPTNINVRLKHGLWIKLKQRNC